MHESTMIQRPYFETLAMNPVWWVPMVPSLL